MTSIEPPEEKLYKRLALCRRRITENTNISLLRLDRGKVMFRTDGLLVRLSDLAWELLKEDTEQSLRERLEYAIGTRGSNRVSVCLSELNDLLESVCEPITGEGNMVKTTRAKPAGIVLMVTQTCNLACRYCYGVGGTYGADLPLMRERVALKGIELMLRRGEGRSRFNVTFFGGEPLLNFKMIKSSFTYCEEIKEKYGIEFRYSLTTNGTALNKPIASFLAKHRFGLMVSLDGTEEVHNRNRPYRTGRGSFEDAIRGIETALSAGLKVQLRATLVKESLREGQIRKLILLAEKLGVSQLVTSPVDCGGDHRASYALSNSDLVHLDRQYGEITRENIERSCRIGDSRVVFDPHASLVKALARGKAAGIGRCGACQSMAAVSTDGKIYPCHRFVGMQAYAIGDVDSGIDETRVDRFFDSAREAFEGSCSNCWSRQICRGTCFYHSADGKGTFDAPDPNECRLARRGVERSLSYLLALRTMAPSEASGYMRATRSF